LLEAIGGEFPKTNLGLATIPPAGQSLVAAWKDPQHAVPRTLFWEHGGNEAVRDGNWKLVRPFNLKFLDPFYDRKQQAQLQRAGGWELYDMEADRAELNNLAAQRPDKVAELDAKFAAWARSVGVTERGNRDGH
jgi:arylsulfatase